MKKCIKVELSKALRNPFFIVVVSLMFLFTMLSALSQITSYQGLINVTFPHAFENGMMIRNDMFALENSFQSWIGAELISLAASLFFKLLPLLVVIPYSISFSKEKSSGYLSIYIPRVGKNTYFACKILTAFFSGFLVVCIPLALNFLIIQAYIPSFIPHVNYNFYTYVNFGDMWADLFFSYPVIYVILYILLDSFVGGVISIIPIALSFFINNKVAILITPFVIFLGIDYIMSISLGMAVNGVVPIDISLLSIIRAAHGGGRVVGYITLIECFALLVVPVVLIMVRGKKDEIF